MLAWCCVSYSQSNIKGVVTDSLQQPLQSASVLVKPLNAEQILAYAISDKNGQFILNISPELLPALIEVNSLGYSSVSLTLLKIPDSKLTIQLNEKANQLDDVMIEYEMPIRRKKDTIEYAAGAFTDKTDVVLADIMKKMPGIEIDSEGKIYYEGTEINKYYIENLDLLGSGYNLANENLPVADVDKVQVLENHQPIKLLDSIVYSDQAAINVKLKKNISVTGAGEAHLGATPFLWQGKATPMVFSKQQQALLSLQSNNTGLDVNRYAHLFASDFSTSAIRKNRWNENKMLFVAPNVLLPLGKENNLQLRVNGNAKWQEENKATNNQTTFFVQDAEILLSEINKQTEQNNSSSLKLELENNTSNTYFKNFTQLSTGILDANSYFIANNNQVNEEDINEQTKIANTFNIVLPVKKNFVSFHSRLSWKENDQPLIVQPGVFSELVNNGAEYEKIQQQIHVKEKITDHTASYSFPEKNWLFTTELSMNTNSRQFESMSKILENNMEETLGYTFRNNQIQTSTNYSMLPGAEYKNNGYVLRFKPHLSYYNYNIKDRILNKEITDSKLSFEPEITVSKQLNSDLKISGTGNLQNRFGSLHNTTQGYILSGYRTISNFDNTRVESYKTSNYSFSVFYQEIFSSLFANATIRYSNKTSDLLSKTSINENASLVNEYVSVENVYDNFRISAEIKKLFSDLNTTVSFSPQWSVSEFPQIINNELLQFTSQSSTYEVDFSTNLSKYNLVIDLNQKWRNGTMMFQTNKSELKESKTTFEVDSFIKEKLSVGIKGEYYQNQISSSSNSILFLDGEASYLLAKRKKLFFRFQNLTNNRVYTSFNLYQNYSASQSLNLRPSQFLIGMNFSF